MSIENLQYFVGKICTIYVNALSQDLTPKQMFTYFTGQVVSIDSHGIAIQRTTGPFRTFVRMENVAAIAEEEVEQLDPENPKDAEIIKAFNKSVDHAIPKGEYVDPDKLKQTYQIMKDYSSQS